MWIFLIPEVPWWCVPHQKNVFAQKVSMWTLQHCIFGALVFKDVTCHAFEWCYSLKHGCIALIQDLLNTYGISKLWFPSKKMNATPCKIFVSSFFFSITCHGFKRRRSFETWSCRSCPGGVQYIRNLEKWFPSKSIDVTPWNLYLFETRLARSYPGDVQCIQNFEEMILLRKYQSDPLNCVIFRARLLKGSDRHMPSTFRGPNYAYLETWGLEFRILRVPK